VRICSTGSSCSSWNGSTLSLSKVGGRDRGLGGVELGGRHLGIGVDLGLLIDPAHALQRANVVCVLRAQIAGVGGVDLPQASIVMLLLFQGLLLGLGEDNPVLGHFGFQRLQTEFEVCQIMAQPD